MDLRARFGLNAHQVRQRPVGQACLGPRAVVLMIGIAGQLRKIAVCQSSTAKLASAQRADERR